MNTLKLCLRPNVYLVAKQQVVASELRRFLKDESIKKWKSDTHVPSQKVVEIAGRLCYMSFARPRPGGNEAYVGHVLESRHGSVIEHATYNLIITGVSRTLTHQVIRHRAGFGFSELSQRFVDGSSAAFVVPPALLGCHELWARKAEPENLSDVRSETFAEWHAGMAAALDAYRKVLAGLTFTYPSPPGIKATKADKRNREAARSVLPGATETKLFLTGNARAFRNFIEQRGDAGADAEIRRLALEVLAVLKAESPTLFEDVEAQDDGTIKSKYNKV